MLWIAFKKEFKESIRKYRLLILVGVLALIGIGSPILAKMMPKIMEMVGSGSDQAGFEFTLKRLPNVNDGFLQYIKNFGMFPILLMLLGMGMVAEERTRGTAELILTKPLSRTHFLLSKFLCFAMILFMGIIASCTMAILYSSILFGKFEILKFLFINLLLFLHLLPFISLIIMLGVFFKSLASVAVAGIGGYIFFLIVNAFPFVKTASPQFLYASTGRLLLNQPPSDLWLAVGFSLIWTFIFQIIGIRAFKTMEI